MAFNNHKQRSSKPNTDIDLNSNEYSDFIKMNHVLKNFESFPMNSETISKENKDKVRLLVQASCLFTNNFNFQLRFLMIVKNFSKRKYDLHSLNLLIPSIYSFKLYSNKTIFLEIIIDILYYQIASDSCVLTMKQENLFIYLSEIAYYKGLSMHTLRNLFCVLSVLYDPAKFESFPHPLWLTETCFSILFTLPMDNDVSFTDPSTRHLISFLKSLNQFPHCAEKFFKLTERLFLLSPKSLACAFDPINHQKIRNLLNELNETETKEICKIGEHNQDLNALKTSETLFFKKLDVLLDTLLDALEKFESRRQNVEAKQHAVSNTFLSWFAAILLETNELYLVSDKNVFVKISQLICYGLHSQDEFCLPDCFFTELVFRVKECYLNRQVDIEILSGIKEILKQNLLHKTKHGFPLSVHCSPSLSLGKLAPFSAYSTYEPLSCYFCPLLISFENDSVMFAISQNSDLTFANLIPSLNQFSQSGKVREGVLEKTFDNISCFKKNLKFRKKHNFCSKCDNCEENKENIPVPAKKSILGFKNSKPHQHGERGEKDKDRSIKIPIDCITGGHVGSISPLFGGELVDGKAESNVENNTDLRSKETRWTRPGLTGLFLFGESRIARDLMWLKIDFESECKDCIKKSLSEGEARNTEKGNKDSEGKGIYKSVAVNKGEKESLGFLFEPTLKNLEYLNPFLEYLLENNKLRKAFKVAL